MQFLSLSNCAFNQPLPFVCAPLQLPLSATHPGHVLWSHGPEEGRKRHFFGRVGKPLFLTRHMRITEIITGQLISRGNIIWTREVKKILWKFYQLLLVEKTFFRNSLNWSPRSNTTIANLICDQNVSKQQFVVKLEGRSLNWPLQSKNVSDKVSVLCSLKVKAVISSQEDKTNYGLISSDVSAGSFRINMIYF